MQDDDISAIHEVSCDMCDHNNILLTLKLITFTMRMHIFEIKTRKINARVVLVTLLLHDVQRTMSGSFGFLLTNPLFNQILCRCNGVG